MAAEQAKDRGNKAFAAGNHADAISSFSEAIALHEKATAAGDAPAGALHVYYSNRSAAYLKLHDGRNALLDAEKCVALKADWAKGHSRKGAALYALGRYADAFRAYKDGLALDPTNNALAEGLRLVEQRMTAPPGASSSSSSSAVPPPASASRASTSSSSSAATKSLRQFALGDKQSSFQLFQFVLRVLMVLNFGLYWLPLVIPAPVAFGNFFKLALINNLSFLAFTHGLPRFKAEYAQRLVMDPTTQSVFFCLIFWVSAPFSLALVPVLLLDLVHLSAYLSSLVQVLGLWHSPVVAALAGRAASAAALVLSDPGFPALPTQSKWAKLYHRMPQVAANVEVAIGLALVLELLTPARNFLLTMLFWQLLRVRYMISPQLQEAFRVLNVSILRLTTHPRCPHIVGTLYAKVQAVAAKMTDMSQYQAAANGASGGAARPRCSVM
ncbi:TPA: hypothetical protein N0F65_009043 [Lagenidium giganteum]|uniref:Uncharacterized protein n=1 Tax=Lagenidium giganteum TaxID=4803 RepID=A0AAV2YX41_9STRA|nr:TPA: hypothetical protein N0F65_009043 [Lagenidium giganteum]